MGKNKMKVDVIVEARMSSTRLPGKVLLPAAGKPLLEIMTTRLKMIKGIDDVIIATTENKADDILEKFAKERGLKYFRGSEEDVMLRVVKAAQHHGTDIIVEITGDDCLNDPVIAGKVVKGFIDSMDIVDISCNDQKDTYPLGFYARAFRRKTLETIEKNTSDPVCRENVEAYFYQNQDNFRFLNIEAEQDQRRHDIRLTLDTEEDYKVIKAVTEALYPKDQAFTLDDVIVFLDNNPQIRDLNRTVKQRTFMHG